MKESRIIDIIEEVRKNYNEKIFPSIKDPEDEIEGNNAHRYAAIGARCACDWIKEEIVKAVEEGK